MALGRKGSRRIVVDGTAYRWRLRRRPTYSQALSWSPCTFAVEHADTPGTTLVVTTGQPHSSNWFGHAAEPVRPSDVAEAVERALSRGWTPTAPGSPFHLDRPTGLKPWPCGDSTIPFPAEGKHPEFSEARPSRAGGNSPSETLDR